MSAIKPSGALLQLPRELRDEIYSHCLNKSYLVFWYYYYDRDHDKRTFADLAILRVSKAISSDAKQLIFSKTASKATTFVFDIGFDSGRVFTAPPTKDATDSMMKVRFNVEFDSGGMLVRARQRAHQFETLCPTFSMESICEATFDRFVDKMLIRDSFLIRFIVSGGNHNKKLDDVMRTPFFQALKSFNGFRNSIVELKWSIFLERNGIVDSQKEAEVLQMELEPRLGHSVSHSITKGVMKHVDIPGSGWILFELTLVLEFQPLKFHIENLRAEAARLTKEADILEG